MSISAKASSKVFLSFFIRARNSVRSRLPFPKVRRYRNVTKEPQWLYPITQPPSDRQRRPLWWRLGDKSALPGIESLWSPGKVKHMHTNTNDGNTKTTSSWPDMKAPRPWRPAWGRMPGWIPWSPWLLWSGRRMWWCLYRGGGPKWKTSSKLKFFHFWDKLIINCIWSLCL